MVQNALAWRLHREGISSGGMHYDMRNAFWSAQPGDLEHAIRRHGGADAGLLHKHVSDLCLVIDGGGDEAELILTNVYGAPPGLRIAAELFLSTFNDPVERWWQQTLDLRMSADLAWEDLRLNDVSLTAFADDVARRLIFRGPTVAAVVHRVAELDRSFDDCMGAAGYMQNLDKRVLSLMLHGAGSKAAMRAILRSPSTVNAEVAHSTRYLGPMVAANGLNVDEFEARLKSANVRFASLRRVFRRSNWRLASNLFRTAVSSTLMDGQVAAAVTDGQLIRMDRAIGRYARSIAAGSATTWRQEGEHPIRTSNRALFRKLRWAGAVIELRIARLRLWQRVLADLSEEGPRAEAHWQLLGAVFGELAFESFAAFGPHGEILESSNPWAKRFAEDVTALAELPQHASFVAAIRGKWHRVLRSGPMREYFVDVQADELRTLVVAVPPHWFPRAL